MNRGGKDTVSEKVCQGCPDRFEGCMQVSDVEEIKVTSFKTGMREVVEWIEKQGAPILLDGEIWQAFLKEKGLSNG